MTTCLVMTLLQIVTIMYWRTITDEADRPILDYELETMIKGFFKPELLLDYLQNFILFEDDGKQLIKKIAGYHLFHGVRAAVESVVSAAVNEQEGGAKKGGVVWQ